MNINIILLDAGKNNLDAIVAYCTLALAATSFIAIFVQIYWNKKILKDANENSKTQLNLLDAQLKSQNDNAFKYTSVKLAENFDQQFQELKEQRAQVADILLEKNLLDATTFDYSLLDKKLDDIYDLFDLIGFFVKHRYIDHEIVHEYFDYWFSEYYTFYTLYSIKKLSAYPNTIWNNLSSLYHAMDIIETGQNFAPRDSIDKKELKRFFKEERGDDPQQA